MDYRTASQTWMLDNGFGSHRVMVTVPAAAKYANAIIPLRRRDLQPELIGMRVVNITTGIETKNVKTLEINREECSVLFEAHETGQYAIYYMPVTITGGAWYFPVVNYMKTEEMKPDPDWLDLFKGSALQATVDAVECRTKFDSFYPMEVPMTLEEQENFVKPYRQLPFMLITEDRYHPVMMFHEFPQIWCEKKNLFRLEDKAAQNEYYTFQIAVYAFQDIEQVDIIFQNKAGKPYEKEVCTCFNAGGVDWNGRAFKNIISMKKGDVLPLWCGVDVEKAKNGNQLEINTVVQANAQSQTAQLTLQVSREVFDNKGDNDIESLTRLRWLDSSIGLDDEFVPGYEPVLVDGLDVSVLGRSVHFGNDGLPHEITSFFQQDCSGVSDTAYPVLASPVQFTISENSVPLELIPAEVKIGRRGSGSVRITGGMTGEGLSVKTETIMEYDGHLDTVITVTALRDIELDDISLIIPYEKNAATYMVGMGAEGGYRPPNWQYKWQKDRANNSLWMGSVNAGLHVKLKHTQDVWELYNYEKIGLPDSWDNAGKGGASVKEKKNRVEFIAASGARLLKAGQTISFRHSLIITPLKNIDYKEHWETRYHHIDTWSLPIPPLNETVTAGARAVILHQGGPLLPYINYPFYFTDKIKEQIDNAHLMGIAYKFYYTVRELSNHAKELPALRSLKGEILREGPGFHVADNFSPEQSTLTTGGPWLLEHLTEGFIPAWQTLLADKDYDSAVATTGLSRWHNYYLEGLSWLVKELGLDGIYLDGVGYDRQIMKRVRKVLDYSKPGCLIDFHSGNNYDPAYGLGSPICTYLELMPSVDSLWLGEGYDYEAKPADYWLVEVSGIPFGLMGEMLQNGGNMWRGMLFGMTCRYGWQQGRDPSPLWRFWDEYHIEDAKMLGFWNPECPVSCGNINVKATVYVSEKYVIIATASWDCTTKNEGSDNTTSPNKTIFNFDTKALGLSESFTLRCPAIQNFQDESSYNQGDLIPIEPGKGKIFVINRPIARP